MPSLIFVTDPDRTPDLLSIAERLPRGAGVIHRGFGQPGARETAAALGRLARARGLTLLIGADAELAAAVGAAGVHLPERLLAQVARVRSQRPGWLLTGAAHSRAALARAGRLELDAALVSPVFPSRSPSALSLLGTARLAAWVRESTLPVIALGGVDARTAPRLLGTGVAGLAAVEAFAA